MSVTPAGLVPPGMVDRIIHALERGDTADLQEGYGRDGTKVQPMPSEEAYGLTLHDLARIKRALRLQSLLAIAIGWTTQLPRPDSGLRQPLAPAKREAL